MGKKNRNRNNRDRALAGLLGTVHAPVTQVEDVPRETAADFRKNFEAQERAKEAAKQEAARNAAAAALFTTPSSELASKIPVFVRGNRTSADLATLASNAYREAKAKLESDGYSLSDSGWSKVAKVISLNDSLDYSRTESWCLTVMHMLALGALDSSECLSLNDEPETQPGPTVQAQPAQRLDDMDTSTPEGRKQVHEVVSAQVFGVEVNGIWRQWVRSLYDNFSYVIPEDVSRKVVAEFQRLNLSWLDKRSYDRVRKTFVAMQIMPETLLTADERLAIAVESQDMSDYETRRSFLNASRAVNS